MDEMKAVIFMIDSEYYGVDIDVVQGVEKVTGLTKIPNTPDYIKGIVNLRGEIIPVYSLRKKFGLQDVEREEMQLIIVRLPELTYAIEIDSIDVIQNIEQNMIFGMPSIVRTNEGREYYEKVLNINGKLVVMIDTSKILSEEEKTSVNEILNS